MTQTCSVKCNDGYDHVAFHVNEFEQCGPDTNWKWSHQGHDDTDMNTDYLCTEVDFVGFRMQADSYYFVDDCNNLKQSDIEQAKAEFLKSLFEKGVCKNSGISYCDIGDVSIECGASESFVYGAQKRQEVKFTFDIIVEPKESHAVDCNKVCDRDDVSERYCKNHCQENYKKMMNKMIRDQLKQAIVEDPAGERINVGDNIQLTSAKSVMVFKSSIDCGRNHSLINGKCVRDCHEPQPLGNGTMTGGETTLGSIYKFSCRIGYRLKGSDSRFCQKNGEWSGIEPYCEEICVRKCHGHPIGDYQSCAGCHYYCTCLGNIRYDKRPCPANLIWDDNAKRCLGSSSTCDNY